MAIQDILPITSIVFMVVGFIVILAGIIWMANTISNEDSNIKFSNTEDIIGEMNQMFSYFTDQIDHGHKKVDLSPQRTKNEDSLENRNFTEVLDLKRQGKTSDQIAKELNIGKGEVNLILGIDQMR